MCDNNDYLVIKRWNKSETKITELGPFMHNIQDLCENDLTNLFQLFIVI